MYCHESTVFAILSVLGLLGQVRSLDDGIPKRVIENGPTGISVDAEEGRLHGLRRLGAVVNGPTAFSVEAQEQHPGMFEFVDVELKDSKDTVGPLFKEDDVDLGNLDNDQDLPFFVNGHTGSSVHREQLMAAANRGVINTHPKENKKQKKLPKGSHISTTDWSRDSSRWSFKSDEFNLVDLPDNKNHPNLPAPIIPGHALVVVTKNPINLVHASRMLEDLENISLHYSYFLSDSPPQQTRPELKVFQVKDGQPSALVSSGTSFGIWAEDSVELPYSGTSKIVFAAQLNSLVNEIAIDDITIGGVSTGFTKQSDGITKAPGEMQNASSTEKPAEVSSNPEKVTEVMEGPGEEEGTVVTAGEVVVEDNGNSTEVGEVTEMTKTTGKGTEAPQETEQASENLVEAGQVTQNPGETQLMTVYSNMTEQGNDTHAVVEGTGFPEQEHETSDLGIPGFTNALELVNQTVISEITQGSSQVNNTFDLTEATQSTSSQDNELTLGTETNITGFVSNNDTIDSGTLLNSDNSTEVSQVQSTSLPNFMTDVVEVTGERNDTEILVTSILPFNLTDNLDYNVTNNPSNSSVLTALTPETNDTETLDVFINQTEQPVLINQTEPVMTNSHANISVNPGNNGDGEGNDTTNLNVTTVQATSDSISNAPVIATSDQGNISNGATTTSLIIINSTSPSGANGTSPVIATGTGNSTGFSNDEVAKGSWGAFKVFLVICILGVGVMGFLYWRRQRRRDDEIPVFSRASQSDYHNPTFTDDDSNFASRGTGHNYKSFE